jgi:transposase
MKRPAARARQAEPAAALPARRPADSGLVVVDRQQRRMADEFGELDRRMQLLAPDVARFESLKRAIKSWFDRMPADAEGTIEGNFYRLHLSARERERRVSSMRALVDVIGLEKFLELASVPIGALEDLLGKTRAAALIVDKRTGSRRIKAVPKEPAGK